MKPQDYCELNPDEDFPGIIYVCSDNASARPITGCYVEGKVYSGERMHFHALVHWVADLAGVRGPLAFREGLAEVFDDDGNEGERRSIVEVLANFKENDDHYYTAALFVRYLFERHGRAAVLDFMRRTDTHDPLERWAPVFASALGESIDSAMAAFADYPSCTAVANRVSLVQCGLPLEPWDADDLSISAQRLAPRRDGTCSSSRGDGHGARVRDHVARAVLARARRPR